MGHEAEDIGGLGQGESAELRPHDDDVVGHPADSEDGDDQEDRLSRFFFWSAQTSWTCSSFFYGDEIKS